MTFGAPVEVPGKALPAGTYVFKLLDSQSNRNIVQIFDKDEKQLFATILAIPNYRLQPADQAIISFEERPAGTPEALKAWFYPGDNYGQQFVYPRSRAVELARQNREDVLSMPDNMKANITARADSAKASGVIAMISTEIGAVNSSGEGTPMENSVSSAPPSK